MPSKPITLICVRCSTPFVTRNRGVQCCSRSCAMKHRVLPCTPLEVRLWSRVTFTDECWEYSGARHEFGYGMIGLGGRRGKQTSTHRLVWLIFFGEIPPKIEVLHKCDNPPCIRPDHLFLGTQGDNNTDAKQKGRSRGGSLPGTKHPNAKMTEALVISMHEAVASGEPIRQLANRLELPYSTVWGALRGPAWKHVRPSQ